MTTFRFICVSILKYRWDLPSGPSTKSSQHPLNIYLLLKPTVFIERGAFGKAKGGGYLSPQVPVIVAGRSEHPFISICELHDQLLLNVEKVKIVIFGS
jgi:hypothetical protein